MELMKNENEDVANQKVPILIASFGIFLDLKFRSTEQK